MTGAGDGSLGAREYLCYHLLSRMEARRGEERGVTRTQFLKLPCIADRRLADRFDVDVGLPRYWYQYGEVLNEQPLDGHHYTVTPGAWGGRNVRPAPGIREDAFDVPEDVRRSIEAVVREVVDEFADRRSAAIREFQYDHHAPNDFVVQFDAFRAFVRDQDRPTAGPSNAGDRAIESRDARATDHLDALLTAYPADVYPDTYDVFLRWEDTTRLLVGEGEFGRAELLLDDFWETLGKAELRFEHGRNTPEDQERQWLAERGAVLSAFDDRLTAVRDAALANREPGGLLDSLTGSGPSEDLV